MFPCTSSHLDALLISNSIPYNYVNLEMTSGDMKSEWYTAINPNGRVPAIVHIKEDGTSVTVFESAACLLYIASEFDKDHKFSYPIGTPEYWIQLSWVRNTLSRTLEDLSNIFPIAVVASRWLWPNGRPSSLLQPVCG